MQNSYEFTSELWLYHGDVAWCFVSLPKEISTEIKSLQHIPRKGFGSVRVKATITKTTWATSIFPDSKAGTYLLPIKKEIRKRNNLSPGDTATISLSVVLEP